MIAMIRHFWRLATRHRLYTALNITGLALGIATFLTLVLVARYELGWDRWYPGARTIYELQSDLTIGDGNFHSDGQPPLLLPLLKARMPELRTTRVEWFKAAVLLPEQADRAPEENETVSFVDPSFFDVFGLNLAQGNAATALSSPDNILLSDEMARKLFGSSNAFGKTLHVVIRKIPHVYRVAGILRPHPRTTLNTDFIAPIPADRPGWTCKGWEYYCANTYAVLPTAAERKRFIQTGRDVFLSSPVAHQTIAAGRADIHFSAFPFVDEHFGFRGVAADGASRDVIYALIGIGVLTLAAGCFNYVNLATAQSSVRGREIAMRKVLGATRAQIARLFLAETLTFSLLAATIAIALTEFAVPLIASLSGWAVTIDYGFLLPVVLGVTLCVTLLAGAYPAFVLSSFSPAPVLASARMPAQGRMGIRLRLILIGLQFCFATVLGICTLVINVQAMHLRHLDRGMNVNNLLLLSTRKVDAIDTHQTALMQAIRTMPAVADATVSTGGQFGMYIVHSVHRSAGDRALMVQSEFHQENFFPTYGIRLLAGRLTTADRATDVTVPGPGRATRFSQNVVVSRELARQLGFTAPQAAIGKSYLDGEGAHAIHRTIVGVVGDVILDSGKNSLPPIIYELQTAPLEGAIVGLRISEGHVPDVLTALRALWPRVVPDAPFSPTLMTEIIRSQTQDDVSRGKLFLFGTGVAIAVACFGLYGLAVFNAERRMHEIGIRKVLGATTGQVIQLVLMQFLRPVLFAGFLAWPVAWLLMRDWLAGFENRIALTPVYFVLVTFAAVLAGALAVLGRSVEVARSEPIVALRVE